MHIGKKILGGVASGGVLTALMALIAFIQIRLVFEFLPMDMAGMWFLFLSIGTYFAFLDLGISPTLSREIAFLAGSSGDDIQGYHKGVADILATCRRAFQSLSALVFLLGIVAGLIFIKNIAPAENLKEVATAWVIFTVGASFNILGSSAFAALYGLGSVSTERLIRSFSLILGIFVLVLLLYFGYGLIGLCTAWVAQNLLARFLAIVFLNRLYPEVRKAGGRASMKIARKIAVPSIKWAAMGLGALLILQVDTPIIIATIGLSDVPPYEAVLKIVSNLMNFSLLAITSSTPFLSRLYSQGDMNAFKQLLLRNVRIGMIAMIMPSAFLAIFGNFLIDLWLGAGNFVGYAVLWTLLIMFLLEVHHVIHAMAAMAAGHIVFLSVAIGSGVLKVILSLLLASYFGVWGVALGTLIAQALTNNWYAPYFTIKTFSIPYGEYFKKIMLPILLFSLVMLAVNTGIKSVVGDTMSLSTFILAFLCSSAISAVLAYVVVLTETERNSLKIRVARVQPRV